MAVLLRFVRQIQYILLVMRGQMIALFGGITPVHVAELRLFAGGAPALLIDVVVVRLGKPLILQVGDVVRDAVQLFQHQGMEVLSAFYAFADGLNQYQGQQRQYRRNGSRDLSGFVNPFHGS